MRRLPALREHPNAIVEHGEHVHAPREVPAELVEMVINGNARTRKQWLVKLRRAKKRLGIPQV